MSKRLQPSRADTGSIEGRTAYVIGGGPVGTAAADLLNAEGGTVTYIDEQRSTDPPPGVLTEEVERIDRATLQDRMIAEPDLIVVVASSDSRNLLLSQLARTGFDAGRIVTLVNDPDRADVFAQLGIEIIEVPRVVADALGDRA